MLSSLVYRCIPSINSDPLVLTSVFFWGGGHRVPSPDKKTAEDNSRRSNESFSSRKIDAGRGLKMWIPPRRCLYSLWLCLYFLVLVYFGNFSFGIVCLYFGLFWYILVLFSWFIFWVISPKVVNRKRQMLYVGFSLGLKTCLFF